MTAWDPAAYLKFGDERTRPAADLLARVPLQSPRTIFDLGCGPGNSTALLAARYPEADLVGVDSSADMLAQARESGLRARWEQANFEAWSPPSSPNLIYANAAFQWSDDPVALTLRLFKTLAPGGVIALQVPQNFDQPSHVEVRAAVDEGPWAAKLRGVRQYDPGFAKAPDYARALAPFAAQLDIWTTEYLHRLDGADPVFRWMSGTGLRPFVQALTGDERAAFEAEARVRLAHAYPAEPDGKTLFPFRRLFVVAQNAAQRRKLLTRPARSPIQAATRCGGNNMLQRMMIVAGALAAAIALSGSSAAQAPAAGPHVATVVHAGRLLADPSTGRIATEQSILIGDDGKIIDVRPGYIESAGAHVIELRDRFVMPGLFDCHVHLTSQLGPNQLLDDVQRTTSDDAMFGALNARKTVEAGFTTVADLGAPPDAIFALRNAINQGWLPGPRIIAAGAIITPHGGHGDVNGYSPDINAALASPGECAGADDCRRAVRQMVQRGADIIKFVATGGVLSNTAAGLGQQFTDDEMHAIVETAHMLGRRAVAHAHGANGINAALRAGVDAIEHGSYLDNESIQLFHHSHAYLVPTLEAGWWVGQLAQQGGTLTVAQTAKARLASLAIAAMIGRARLAHVPIAFGTDTGVSPHGQNAKEFELLVQQGGYTPLETIQFATVAAADHLGLSDVAGRLMPGMSADIIAVEGDPTTNVSLFRDHIRFVMARGVVDKSE